MTISFFPSSIRGQGHRIISHKCKALAFAASIVMPTIALSDCNGLGVNTQALAALADATCALAEDGEGWIANSCDVWSDVSGSDLPASTVDLWNLLQNGGSGTIGPRPLDPGVAVSGRLLQPGTRVFVLNGIADNEVNVDLNYEDGSAGVEMDICAVDPQGDRTVIASFSDLDSDQNGLDRTITMDDGAALLLKLKPTGGNVGPSAYEYNIEVTFNNHSGPATTLETNTDRPGRDYRNFAIGLKSSGAGKRPGLAANLRSVNERRICRRACADDQQCAAWTFVRGTPQKQAHCWLKDEVPAQVSDSCCDSGVRN